MLRFMLSLLVLLSFHTNVYSLEFSDKPANSKIIEQVVGDDELILTRSNFVSLRGMINGETVSTAITELQKNKSKSPILFIHSGGGEIMAGLRLIQFIKDSPRPIRCYASYAASMAFTILQSCHERIIGDTSYLMQHQSSGGADGQFENVKAEVNTFWQGLMDLVESAQAKRMKITTEQLRKNIAHDWHLIGSDVILKNHAADKIKRVQCEADIADEVYTLSFNIFGFTVTQRFSRCPIASGALSTDISQINYGDKTSKTAEQVLELVRKYLNSGF